MWSKGSIVGCLGPDAEGWGFWRAGWGSPCRGTQDVATVESEMTKLGPGPMSCIAIGMDTASFTRPCQTWLVCLFAGEGGSSICEQ